MDYGHEYEEIYSELYGYFDVNDYTLIPSSENNSGVYLYKVNG
jgi:hypothetical protein